MLLTYSVPSSIEVTLSGKGSLFGNSMIAAVDGFDRRSGRPLISTIAALRATP
jgi:hypothetical protein